LPAIVPYIVEPLMMATNPSHEDICPALPILGSTLLDLETDPRRNVTPAGPFSTDVSEIDDHLPPTLWTGGKVIGIGGGGGASLVRTWVY
jgi:hypothetical protein